MSVNIMALYHQASSRFPIRCDHESVAHHGLATGVYIFTKSVHIESKFEFSGNGDFRNEMPDFISNGTNVDIL